MDEIQKVLVAQGRKDLAQKYYEKIAQPTGGPPPVEPNWNQLSNKLQDTFEKEVMKQMQKGPWSRKEIQEYF